jgi:pimeloyl-ACP methyl ester carboxylesterase
MTTTVNGIRLTYSDTGPGVQLLCLHGGMGVDAGTLQVPGILELAKFGVRVIIPDQRGHGKSERSTQSEYSHRTWVSGVRGQHSGVQRAETSCVARTSAVSDSGERGGRA